MRAGGVETPPEDAEDTYRLTREVEGGRVRAKVARLGSGET